MFNCLLHPINDVAIDHVTLRIATSTSHRSNVSFHSCTKAYSATFFHLKQKSKICSKLQMGNSHSVPANPGENVKDYVRRRIGAGSCKGCVFLGCIKSGKISRRKQPDKRKESKLKIEKTLILFIYFKIYLLTLKYH